MFGQSLGPRYTLPGRTPVLPLRYAHLHCVHAQVSGTLRSGERCQEMRLFKLWEAQFVTGALYN